MSDLLEKLPVKEEIGKITLIEMASIFYIQAERDDSLIRTRRKKPYRASEKLGQIEKRLCFPFFRCHRSFILNVNRVRAIERKGRDYVARIDPPVNAVIPISRDRYGVLARRLKV